MEAPRIEKSTNSALLNTDKSSEACPSCADADKSPTFIEQDYRLIKPQKSSISFVVVTQALFIDRLISLLHALVPLKYGYARLRGNFKSGGPGRGNRRERLF